MKKTVYLIIIAFATVYLSSCKDMDETYKEFIVPNGLTYPQKPTSLKVQAGYNSVRISWLKANDPSIARAEIYWNNYLDTFQINNIPADRDTIVADIPNLDEITYTFRVKTFDANGNASVPAEAFGTPYGEVYIMKATDRILSTAVCNEDGNGIITWGLKTADLIYTEVRYKTNSGETRTIRILPGENALTCPDAKPRELFEYRSVFLPLNGAQVVEKEWVTFPFCVKLSRDGWEAASRGGNHNWGVEGGEPRHALDGNMSTGWHSNTSAPLPQCWVVDMKRIQRVHNIILYPQEAYNYIRNFEVYVSETPIIPDVPQPSWGAPVATVQAVGSSTSTVIFPSVLSAQYIAIVFTSSSSRTYINLMEFEAFGY
jgi:hypothetical protein